MHASRSIFDGIFVSHHNFSIFFQKRAPCLGGEHNFEKRRWQFSIKKITFLTYKRLQTTLLLHFFVDFVALLRARFPLSSQRAPMKKRLCIEPRAVFASGPPFAKTTLQVVRASFTISFAIGCFLYAFYALHTAFLQFFYIFLEIVLPPWVGSTILQNEPT